MTELRYAGFWRRVVALAVDMLLLAPFYWLLGQVVEGYAREVVLSGLLIVAYGVAFASRWQGSVGMKLLRVKAVTQSGMRLSFWHGCGWSVANSLGVLLMLGGLLYLQVAYQLDAVSERIQAGDVAGAEALLGMPFMAFYQMMLVAVAGSVVLGLIWSLSIALGKQKAGFINRICGVRFVRG